MLTKHEKTLLPCESTSDKDGASAVFARKETDPTVVTALKRAFVFPKQIEDQ